eukprot:3313988-Prymnesium_polylepis.1
MAGGATCADRNAGPLQVELSTITATRISTQVAGILITSSRTRRDITSSINPARPAGVPRNVGERTVAQGEFLFWIVRRAHATTTSTLNGIFQWI